MMMMIINDAVDFRGIGGWEKVDKLARALIDLSGLAVTNSQAREITELHQALPAYDKLPLEFKATPRKPSRGRFGRKRSGHTGVEVEQMKR